MDTVKKKTDELDFEIDPRYKQCNKEAIIGMILGGFNLIWWFAWGYGLGDKPVEEYSYILGIPAWFFMSCIAGCALMVIIVLFVIKVVFKHMSLEALSEEEIAEYRKAEK